jgi:putative nucleotidyltransferase with HDIG domain
VANLAKKAADVVGGSPLVARVGSRYHDVGKMQDSMYFIENQRGDMNPHDEIDFEESAEIIIGHVPKGVEIAKDYHLPELVIDFIRTHHGTSRVEYFYQSYLQSYPKEFVDESKFRYPGPIPFSKETAVLMLADSVEAASRSLRNPSEHDLDSLVDDIIDHKMEDDQLVNADLTFKDLSTIRKLFKKRLKSIYHVRISYPGGA